MSEKKASSQQKRIALGFAFVCSVLLIIAGCLLIFIIPAANSSALFNPDGKQNQEEKSDPKLSSEAEKYLHDLLCDTSIELSFGGSVEKLDYNNTKSWVTAEKDGSGFRCVVSDSKLYEYTEMLADKYNTFESRITFTNSSGKETTLDNMGNGWVFDSDYAADMIRSYLVNGESADLDLTDRSRESNKWWLRVCADYDAVSKKGDCYAEVSIDQQYMWVYKNGKVILKSDIVTGSPDGHDTPKGAYIIYEKKSPATLYGPGYVTDVSYWIAFIDDIGFHDATWQTSFGGTTYLYNGSHGCVNLPLDFAEKLYKTVYKNMPVYVY